MTLLRIPRLPEPTAADLELLRQPATGPAKRTGTLLALPLLPEPERAASAPASQEAKE